MTPYARAAGFGNHEVSSVRADLPRCRLRNLLFRFSLVPAGSITPELKQFISRCIRSVEQVEILSVFNAHPGRLFTVQEVYRQVQSSEKSVAECLEGFCKIDLLAAESGGYRLAPKTPELAKAANELAVAYRERRVTVIQLIYAKPTDTIQDFADAFRFRKEK